MDPAVRQRGSSHQRGRSTYSGIGDNLEEGPSKPLLGSKNLSSLPTSVWVLLGLILSCAFVSTVFIVADFGVDVHGWNNIQGTVQSIQVASACVSSQSSTMKKQESFILYPELYTTQIVLNYTSRNSRGNKVVPNVYPPLGHRLIACRVFIPALGAGTGQPASVPASSPLYSGSYSAASSNEYKASLSATVWNFSRSWSDSPPITAVKFPVVILLARNMIADMYGIAEDISAAGFIVVVMGSHGLNNAWECPTCANSVTFQVQRDIRFVVTQALESNLGFSGNQIKRLANGMPAIGCAGHSGAGASCVEAAGGGDSQLTTLFPTITDPSDVAPDYRIAATLTADQIRTNGVINATNYNASLALWGSGAIANWLSIFPLYKNAKTRILYDLPLPHFGVSYRSSNCPLSMDLVTRFLTGTQTARDVAVASTYYIRLSGDTAYCPPTNWSALPMASGIPSTLSTTSANGPTSGISYTSLSLAMAYYHVMFFRATLHESPVAQVLATNNGFPNLIDNIYVDEVPGILRKDFNLAGRELLFDLNEDGTQYLATSSVLANGVIPDPATVSGAVPVYTTNFDDDLRIVTLQFSFPLHPSFVFGLPSVQQITVSPNGVLGPALGFDSAAVYFHAKRLESIFENSGTPFFAPFAHDFTRGTLGKVYMINDQNEFTVTWYKIRSTTRPATVLYTFQCSLYPNGTIRMVYDTSMPSELAILGESASVPSTMYQGPASALVGISTGRIRVAPGSNQYIYQKNPHVYTIDEVLEGKNTEGADAIFQTYSAGIPASTASAASASSVNSQEQIDLSDAKCNFDNNFCDDILIV
jgi:hypothetical protein